MNGGYSIPVVAMVTATLCIERDILWKVEDADCTELRVVWGQQKGQDKITRLILDHALGDAHAHVHTYEARKAAGL